MNEQATISGRLTATAAGLTVTVTLDGLKIWQGDPHGGHDIVLQVDDDDATHVLKFTMSDKTPHHTQIDQSGTIIQDVTVSIQDLAFADIALGQLLYEKAVYQHDFNGTGPVTDDRFYGTMGCNGTVTLSFTTPVYLWLLEHM